MTALPPTALPRRRSVTWLDLLAVAALTLAVFAPVLRSAFSPLDDYLMIASNPAMQTPSWDGLASFWSGPWYRIYMPLAQTVWMAVATVSYTPALDAKVHVLVPLGFKIASVVTHAAAAAAAAFALSRLTRTRWPAVVGGLAFALHPLQVESVAWTTGLKDELCGLWAIVAVGCYATHVRRDRSTPWGDAWWWLALLAAVLATASKPTAMVLPVLLTAVDLTLRRCELSRRVTSLVLFTVPAIGCALIIANAQASSAVARVGLPLRPLVAMDSYAFYATKIAWPTHLSIDYGRQPTWILSTGAIWFTWLLPAALAVTVAVGRSGRWLLAAALFAVPILPVAGLQPFDMQQFSTVTDHYTYLPLFGVGLAIALTIIRWPRSLGPTAIGLLAIWAVLTFRQADVWRSAELHYREVLASNPRSWMARTALASIDAERGDLFTATRLCDETTRLNPHDAALMDAESYIAVLRGDYATSKACGLVAIRSPILKRPELGRRLALLGRVLHDRDLAEAGVRYWLSCEPTNQYVRGMLNAIEQSKRQDAATRPAPPPATESGKI